MNNMSLETRKDDPYKMANNAAELCSSVLWKEEL